MATPEGHKPRRAAVSEGTRRDSQRTTQMPECDGARERSRPTGRLPAPRSQKQPDDQTGEVKTREKEPRQTPGEDTQGKTGKKSIRTQSMERTGRPNPHGNLKSFLEGRRHWIRQQHTDRSRGVRKANSQTETVQKRLISTGTE